MTIAIIALAIALTGALGLIAYLVHSNSKRVDQAIAASDATSATREQWQQAVLEAERTKFELKTTAQALLVEQRLADSLEEFIANDAPSVDPNADLAPDDVANRVLRIFRKARGAQAGRGGAVPPIAVTDEVRPSTTDLIDPTRLP